jgi:hypothetical protein
VVAHVRLIWKQNRFEVLAVLAICLVTIVAALIEAHRLNSVVFPKDCTPGVYYPSDSGDLSACTLAGIEFGKIYNGIDMVITRILLIAVPFVGGILVGAPLVAREIEHGTAPISWALAGSRRRWLSTRLLAAALLLVPLLIGLAYASNVLEGAINRGWDPSADFHNYLSRGVPVILWGVLAATVATLLGVGLGRTLPAVFLALVVCLSVRVVPETDLRTPLLSPFVVQLQSATIPPDNTPDPSFYAPDPQDLITDTRVYLDGQPFNGDVNEWMMAHQTLEYDTNGKVVDVAMPDPSKMPVWVPFGIKANHYWEVVLLWSGLLSIVPLVSLLASFFWIGRRRPY